jgi:cephalosporin-C deacetylase-like acetyl esterase
MLKLCVAGVLVALFSMPAMAQQSEELNFASGLEQFQNLHRMLPSYLNNTAFRILEERKRHVQHLSTIEDVNKRRAYLREQMLKDLGGFPEKTSLNARVVGVLDRNAYRIEKVVFESQPHFYVTANLYLPKNGHPPYPAILYPLGHERGGKTNSTWQQMLGSLATKGFVALTWDPIGQGERLQIYDEDLHESKVGDSTTEHTVVGAQCMLIGDHVARYTIWDGIRALDYLLSRKEVDPARIGLTGNSGGGTHTAYIATLDDRIKVAAPSCYITSWHLMLDTIGPQDAEQTFPFWLQEGIDYPDYLYAFAPKPYLVLSAIRDFFPIAGARETFAEAEKVYSAIGAKEKLSMFEADDGHGYNKGRRLAAYDWFSRWLKGTSDTEPEPQIEMATPEELRCTPTGQVATSLGGESVLTLNQKRLATLKTTQPIEAGDLVRKAREAIRYEPPAGALKITPYGTISRSGYHIDKLIYESEPGILIPSLLYVPDAGAAKHPAVLMATGNGKADSARTAEQFAMAGAVVLSIDARGIGETRVNSDINSREFDRYFGDFNDIMTALLVGKTMVGMRALDISRGLDLLVSRKEVDPNRIYGFGEDSGALPLLYAALLDTRIRKVMLDGMLASYESVVNNKVHRRVLEGVVPGMLKSYDLPDLVSALATRDVWIIGATDPLGHELPANDVAMEYRRAIDAFGKQGASQAIRIKSHSPDQDITEVYRELTATQK